MASHNKGKITASTVSAILTGKGDNLLKGGISFARQIAMERLGVIDDISTFTGNNATKWGNENEQAALDAYEANKMVNVYDSQKQITHGYLSCTPDGLIGSNGLVEVKCPFKSTNHLDNLIENSFVSDYENQCRFQMMLSDRDYCDLVSYDPRFPTKLELHIVRLERDKDWDSFCMDRINQAEIIINDILVNLKAK